MTAFVFSSPGRSDPFAAGLAARRVVGAMLWRLGLDQPGPDWLRCLHFHQAGARRSTSSHRRGLPRLLRPKVRPSCRARVVKDWLWSARAPR